MTPAGFLKSLDKQVADTNKVTISKQKQADSIAQTNAIINAITQATKALIAFQAKHEPKVAVTNQKKITIPPVKAVLDPAPVVAALKQLESAVKKLPTSYPEVPQAPESVIVKNQPDYTEAFNKLEAAISKIDVKPEVTVNTPDQPDDYTPIVDSLNQVLKAVKGIKFPEIPQTDLSPLIEATNSVQDAIANQKFPVPNYVLPFKDKDGKATQVQLQSDGSLPITASISTGGLATSANQTNNSQTTQIVDSSGNAVTVTGNKLDVNATASLAGSSIPIASATTAVGVAIVDSSGNQISSFGGGTQYTDAGTPPTHPVGTVPVYNNGTTWSAVSSTNKLPVNTGLTQPTTPSDTQPVSGTFWQATQPVSAASLPLPTGAATSANQSTANTSLSSIATNTTNIPNTVGTAASAIPSKLLQIGGSDGTNARAVKTNTSGQLDIRPLTSSDQVTTVPSGTQTVSGTVTANAGTGTFAVSAASLPLPSGAATAAKQPALGTAGTASADVLTVQGIASMTALKVDGSAVTQPVSGTFWQTTQPVSLASVPSHPVTNAGTFAIQDTGTTTTSTQTSVANSITSVTLLSSNTSRKSATIYNDDTAAYLYVKFGTTASTTSFKIKIAPGGYYEFPYPIYTGRVDAIASAATGSARVCEET